MRISSIWLSIRIRKQTLGLTAILTLKREALMQHYIGYSYRFFEICICGVERLKFRIELIGRIAISDDFLYVIICVRCKPCLRLERHFQHQD